MAKMWGVKVRKRRYVEVWIVFLMLFSVNFFDIIPIMNMVGPNGAFTFFLLTLFLMFTFKRKAWIGDTLHWLDPFWVIMAGVVLSYIPSLLYYDQGFVQSFFTNRRMFELVSFPILIALRPTEWELRKALYCFSVLFLLVSIIVTFLAPDWVYVNDNSIFVYEGDYLHSIPGIRLVALAFIFSLNQVKLKSNRKNVAWTLFLFGIIFLAQNRTTLLASIVLAGFILYTMKMSARKIILIVVVVLTVLLMFVYTSGQWGALYQETLDQISNPEYNRIKALNYMFARRNFLRYMLGDGFISANVNPIIIRLQEDGIFHSDVGFVGMWHQYGVLPVAAILVITIKGLASRWKPFIVRAAAIYVLVGALTLSYFALGESMMWLSIFFYLYYSECDADAGRVLQQNARIWRRRIRRPRDIKRRSISMR